MELISIIGIYLNTYLIYILLNKKIFFISNEKLTIYNNLIKEIFILINYQLLFFIKKLSIQN